MINGRNKGLSYEREVANKLRFIFPHIKRHLEVQAQEALGFDLDNSGNFLIQIKRGRQYANPNKIEEIHAQENKIPVLITKADRKKDIVCFYLDDLLHVINLFKVDHEAALRYLLGEK